MTKPGLSNAWAFSFATIMPHLIASGDIMTWDNSPIWYVPDVDLVRPSDAAEGSAIDNVVNASAPQALFIRSALREAQCIAPFHRLRFQPSTGTLRPPHLVNGLAETRLLVDVPCDLAWLAERPQTDAARVLVCQDLFMAGVDRLPSDMAAFRAPFLRGLDAAAKARFSAPLQTPERSCVIGAELLIEVSYTRTPSQKHCHLRIWRPGRSRQAYEKVFVLVPEPSVNGVAPLFPALPIQGAILRDGMLRMAQSANDDGHFGGLSINPLMAAYDIPLSRIEAVIGPVKRVEV